MDVTGTSALVTGGASGIGAAVVRQLAAAGARVVVVDRNEELGAKIAAELGGAFALADVTSEADVQSAVETATSLAPLRVAVNCAGIGWAERTVDRSGAPHSLEAFQKVVGVNLVGTFNVVRLVAVAMNGNDPLDDGERGVIVNTASVAAFDGQIGQAAYAASKGGVVALTLAVARDLSATGIRVCTIAPGLVDTPLLGTLPDEARQALAAGVPFPKRLGRPEDVASLAMEIVRNGYINGETIRMDAALRMPPK